MEAIGGQAVPEVDAAALAQVREVQTDASEPSAGGQERAQRVEIDLEPPARQARGGPGGQRDDLGPAQLKSYRGQECTPCPPPRRSQSGGGRPRRGYRS